MPSWPLLVKAASARWHTHGAILPCQHCSTGMSTKCPQTREERERRERDSARAQRDKPNTALRRKRSPSSSTRFVVQPRRIRWERAHSSASFHSGLPAQHPPDHVLPVAPWLCISCGGQVACLPGGEIAHTSHSNRPCDRHRGRPHLIGPAIDASAVSGLEGRLLLISTPARWTNIGQMLPAPCRQHGALIANAG